MEPTTIYLIIHGITTLGVLLTFLLRNENRITKLETQLSRLQQEHDARTNVGVRICLIDDNQP